MNKYYQAGIRRFVKGTRNLWPKLGLQLTLDHFYWPVPTAQDMAMVDWKEGFTNDGLEMRDEHQVQLAKTISEKYKEDFANFHVESQTQAHLYYRNNTEFKTGDAEYYYGIIRENKPKRIFEIGSGFSTCLAAQAILDEQKVNPNYNCELVAIEPFPRPMLLQGFPGFSKLEQKKVQQVPLDFFKQLEENDILFIDSSHVLKTGSDVQFEFLKILPILNKGVIVQVHDIFFPYEYPKEWITKNMRFWNEQYLLHAFLLHNSAYEVMLGGSYLHARYQDLVQGLFPRYQSDGAHPGSFWIRKIK